jgi:hypothetical protein
MGMSVEDRRDGCVETLNDLICWSQWFEMGWLGFGRYQSIEIDRGTHRWYQEAYVPLPRLVPLPFRQLQVQSQARPIVLKGLSPWFARRAKSFAILNVTSWSRQRDEWLTLYQKLVFMLIIRSPTVELVFVGKLG